MTVPQLRKKYESSIEEGLSKSFERSLLAAAFDNLEIQGALRFNNFSYALRELLRHVLHRLAPDSEVKQCTWFNPHNNATNGITRSHRVTYAIQGGLSDAFVERKLRIDVPSVRSDLIKALEVLNKHTHIEPATFNIDQRQTTNLAEECLKATKYLVTQIEECRKRVAHSLSTTIDEHLLNRVISETIDSIDELATHHSIDEVYVEHLEVLELGATFILVQVSGTVECELQYGSNSDIRNDTGAITPESFPFSASLKVKLDEPLGKEASIESFKVDTRSWYG